MEQPAAPSRRHRLPAELPVELIEEILLRIPPKDLAVLVSLTLVSPIWRGIVRSRNFTKEYRSFHGTQPALAGFFQNLRFFDDKDPIDRFVRAVHNSSPLVQPELHTLDCLEVEEFLSPVPIHNQQDPAAPKQVLDCRHGMVLLRTRIPGPGELFTLTAWEPVTDSIFLLPQVPFHSEYSGAAILCTVPHCNHRNCRRDGVNQEEFKVIFVSSVYYEDYTMTSVAVFSSATGVWTPVATQPTPAKSSLTIQEVGPSRLVGGAIFFLVEAGQRILKYNLADGQVSFLAPPNVLPANPHYMLLIRGERGRLGLAAIVDSDQLQIWSYGGYGWVLEDRASLHVLKTYPRTKSGKLTIPSKDLRGYNLLGSSEDTRKQKLFISSGFGIFVVDVDSVRYGQLKRNKVYAVGTYCPIFPYVCY